LEQGLYHYGHGETALALSLWKQALEIDPRNEVAREYLSIEFGPSWDDKLKPKEKPGPRQAGTIKPPAKPKKSHLADFDLGTQHLKGGRPESAFSIFSMLADKEPENTTYKSHLELSKNAAVKSFLKEIGAISEVPMLRAELSSITDLNLTEEQGFILSLINGETSFEDIVYLSPVAPFTTFSTLKRFFETGLIGLKPRE